MVRAFTALGIGLGLWISGCGDSSSELATLESTSGTVDGTSTAPATSNDDLDTGVAPPGCGANLLEDPGFEGGGQSSVWAPDSELFDTPICDASCTDDVGANPFTGNWWVWFGGVARADTASVSQRVHIPEGNAMLRFRFSVNAGSGTGNDLFSVMLGAETLLQVRDTEVESYGGWRILEVDVSSYADGDEHELSFGASLAGVGLTSFFVDDVELLLCDPEGTSSSSSSSSGGGTEGASSTSSGR